MNIQQSLFLGMVQGITEFLPVSSSAHLVFFQHFFHLQEPSILFNCLLHFSTFLVTTIFFWTRIRKILKFSEEGINLIKLIFIGCLPTGIIGLTLGKIFERTFENIFYPAFFLLITGLLLWFAEKKKFIQETSKQKNFRNAFLIGLVQGIALLPGISRSGSTISTGILLGWSPIFAAEFSFLLSLPAIFGVTLMKLLESGSPGIKELIIYLPGMFFAFLFGLGSLKFLWYILVKRNWRIFSYYCWGIGLTVLFISFFKR